MSAYNIANLPQSIQLKTIEKLVKKKWQLFKTFEDSNSMEKFFKCEYSFKTVITHGNEKNNTVKCTICSINEDQHVFFFIFL